uniref:glycerophosphodiester phosphodiesterase n=1 Tax=Aegilops tauschii subsp. strangulata TaxID=200361 RepID=A0A453FSI9_AEGTS
MALLKAARVADVPSLDVVVPDHLAAAARVLGTCRLIRRPRVVSTFRLVDRPAITCVARARATADAESAAAMKRQQRGAGRRFAVIGHRGKGMNALASPDRRLQEVKENSIRSFNEAARFAVDYVEFDVQVTKDVCPVIFHDNFIVTEEHGKISEKRVTDLQLEDFLQYGPQNKQGKNGKPLLRKMKDGRVLNWNVQSDDPLCTLQEAFEKVNPRLGFNVELKFDDNLVYQDEELTHILQAILKRWSSSVPRIGLSFSLASSPMLRSSCENCRAHTLCTS